MNKLIAKSLFLLALVLSTIGIINSFYTRTNYWIRPDRFATLKFKNVPDHIELANIGSSHGYYGLDFCKFSYRSFNFALYGQFFMYDYAILRQYIEKFDKNAILLIPISYFQISKIKTDFQSERPLYYSFLSKKYMDSWSMYEKLRSMLLVPALTAGDNLKFIINDQPSITNVLLTTMEEQDIINNGITIYKMWTTDSDGFGFEAGEEGLAWNKNWVSLIVEFCYAHDIQPVLVSFPVTSVLNNIYTEESPGFFDNFYRFTRELQESYPSLPYFDYSHDSHFSNDYSLFFDSVHLNGAGTEKFTAAVILDLQASGLLSQKD
jgi:hypothetical protein